MYDMTKLYRTWEVLFVDGKQLHIKLPKVSVQYKLNSLSKDNDLDILSRMMKMMLIIINNNEENIIYTEENLKELLTEDEVTNFLSAYTDWRDKSSDDEKN